MRACRKGNQNGTHEAGVLGSGPWTWHGASITVRSRAASCPCTPPLSGIAAFSEPKPLQDTEVGMSLGMYLSVRS